MWFQLLDNGMHYTLFLFISSITVIFYYTLYNTLYSIINQEKKKLLLHLTEINFFFFWEITDIEIWLQITWLNKYLRIVILFSWKISKFHYEMVILKTVQRWKIIYEYC